MAKEESEEHRRMRHAENECGRLRDELARARGDATNVRGRLVAANDYIKTLRTQLTPRPMSEAPDNEYVLVKADGTWREGIIEDGRWQCPAGHGELTQLTGWLPLPKEGG